MRKKTIALLICCVVYLGSFAQSITVSGNVRNSNSRDAVSSVSVLAKGTSIGTFTDEKGDFKLTVEKLPVVIVFSSVNYETQEINVTSNTSSLQVELVSISQLGQEVVVSASRYAERLIESPVTIERVSAATIRNSPASSYYDIVTTLKGVDVIASSMTFKTPSTRGFAGSGNTRFNQIVDGMDNQAPGLNFSVGAVIGLTELDVESMELLPGASSALYGPGGMNGTLLINSKSPFKYPGLSFQIKTGIMHTDKRNRNVSPYYNWSLRWAEKVSDKFAFKISTELIQAQDWLADDNRNYDRLGTTGKFIPGTRETDPNYDGANVYGDETSVNLKSLVLDAVAQQVPFWRDYINTLPSEINVSRTGYTEKEVANPNTVNFKFSGAVHYKITPKIEAILAGHIGTGNTVYSGNQRYSLRELKMAQYKLELNHKNWFVRTYTTQENAGESYNLTITSQLFNEAWKPSPTWYQQYGFAYVNALMAGRPDLEAHNIARSTADQGRPEAGSQQFKTLFDQVRQKPIPIGGLFLDKTDLWMTEGQYNFTDAVKFMEVLVGGNWKKYILNSEGTLFADKPGEPIKINEYGAYIQLGKEVVKDVLKLTAAGRYDKNQNFKGRFTPRVTAVIKPAKDHNIRLSYQTAYRFPSTQQQWINLDVGTGILIGANKSLWEMYDLIDNPGYDPATVPPQGTTLEKVTYKEVSPESVTSYEAGYKALIGRKFLLDLYGYYGTYKNFLTRRDVAQFGAGVTPVFSNPYQGVSVVVNSPEDVRTYGWGISGELQLNAGFVISANLSSDKLRNSDLPQGYRAFFNAPELRTVVSLANTGFGKKKTVGFNVSWRWMDGFFYENDFIQGDLPGFHVVDASINFKCPKIKSMVKVGANNLLNQYYRTAVGNPSIGGLYYVSFAYHVF